jgi:hypothetical protein
MLGRIGLAAAVLLFEVPLFATAAAATTPLTGQYLKLGTAQVRVLPGNKSASVTITDTIGFTGVVVSLPNAVKISNGSFSYSGKTIWRWATPPVRELPGTGTITGTFTSPKNLTLSYNLKRGGSSLRKSNVKLTFSAATTK